MARTELLDSMVPALEAMRHEMKTLLLDAQEALLEAGLPRRRKRDADIPFYYGSQSWTNEAEVPWNIVSVSLLLLLLLLLSLRSTDQLLN